MIRRVVLACAVLLATATSAFAQEATQSTQSRDETTRARILDKLRAIEAASTIRQVDSTAAVADSTAGSAAPDSAAVPTAPDVAADSTASEPSAVLVVESVEVVAPDPTRPAAEKSDPVNPAAVQVGAPPIAAGGGGATRPPLGQRLPETIVPAAQGLPSDSVLAALRALQGYTLTEYQAEQARFRADSGSLELIGSPSITREGQGMTADSLVHFDQRTSVMCGFGNPVLSGDGSEPVESEIVCYDVDRETGVAIGARTKFSKSATWYVHGDLYTKGRETLYGTHAEFTSCDLDVPHYHFRAKDLKVVNDQILVARDVTLRFADVPVFWLPFMVQSMKQGRRSGLLQPSFGIDDIVRTSSGQSRSISNLGFYWAINDYMDSEVALDWQSGSHTAMTGGLRFNWTRQFLNGSLAFTRFWQQDGQRNFSLNSSFGWRPGERTTINGSGRYASSSSVVRDISFDPNALSRTIGANAGLNHRFTWGGSLNLSASRQQHLMTDQVDWTLPSASLSLPTVTLFPATGEARWYNNATWSGSVQYRADRRDANELLPNPNARDSESKNASLSSRFSIGGLSFSQSARFDQKVNHAKPGYAVDDTTFVEPLERELRQEMNWDLGLGYSQRLIGTSTLSPSISLRGGFLRPDSMTSAVAAPVRISTGASLKTDIYGFWPGVGPATAIRHHIQPTLSYSYSPEPKATKLQRDLFGDNARESNSLRLTISQTFEAKLASTEAADTAAVDTVGALSGEPRRLPQAQKIMILSLSTSAMVYDFARAKRGEYGFTTEQLTHTIRSDLLRDLSLSVGHDLFNKHEDGTRSFAPRLRTVTANFNLSNESGIFRLLGLGGGSDDSIETEAADSASADDSQSDDSDFLTPGRNPTIGGDFGMGMGTVGTWNAQLTYNLARPEAGSDHKVSQTVRGTVSFQPTQNWRVSWQGGYDFTEGAFNDHFLTLTRNLHRWQANFSFVKAQNGNFSFRFHVRLLDNDALELDYDQRSGGSLGGRGGVGIR